MIKNKFSEPLGANLPFRFLTVFSYNLCRSNQQFGFQKTLHLPKTIYSYYSYDSYDNMNYRTINVTSGTYEKLVLYKHGNMSFDDVINEFMKFVEEKKFYNHVLKEHRKRMLKIKSGDFIESDNLKDALKNI